MIDNVVNNSGTYSPDPLMLPDLKECLEYNFLGFTIHARDRNDRRLSRSCEACSEYALNNRGVRQEELQPHAPPGKETLSQTARTNSGPQLNEDGSEGAEGTTVGEPVMQYY